MKKFSLLLLLSFSGILAFGNHITGGEMYYILTGQSGNSYTYHVTLKLYRDCNAPPGSAELDVSAPISIFRNSDNVSVWANTVDKKPTVILSLDKPNPCINNPPVVCYQVGYYEFDVTLPGTAEGYTITYQRCCRIAGINNLINSNSVGATYRAFIPGTSALASGPANNSAHFIGDDKVIICANNPFCYDFGAQDGDGDQLSYSFCTAYTGGTTVMPSPNPPNAPSGAGGTYPGDPYAGAYSPDSPLGAGVTLDPKTGMMCGIAPEPGIYVVTVCVTETRNGVAIAVQRKDLQIKVGDCSSTKPALKPAYITCDGFNLFFFNQNNNPLIHTYLWDFGDGTTSTEAAPTHTFSDTGTYAIKLLVNKGEPCSDEGNSVAKVYPGFFPGFDFRGICVNKPTQFFDTSKTKYGVVSGWSWDFGDPNTTADVSSIKNPTYTYSQLGTKNVRFIVTTNKGCIDTVNTPVTIIDKPPIKLLPKDTLICNGDFVQLNAQGSGNFSWTGPNMINANTATPTVKPTITTNYVVQLDDNGCLNKDSVRVRVVDFVTLKARPDTVMCATDSLQLTAFTDGLRFSWTPAANINGPNLLSPMVLPTASPTTYTITATIGSCSATDKFTVTLVPYPGSNAGPDTIICYNTTAQLHGSMVGSSFVWSPSSSLSNANSLNPVARPPGTTAYILSVRDNLGCPKPKLDTVLVTVLPKVNAFAGRDTAVVVGQPLHFNATGGVDYLWTPGTSLNNIHIADPTAYYDGSFDSISYKVVVKDIAGCSDSDIVKVKIFRTNPQIFVPTAFTPNGDGVNDYFRPIAVGISRFDYFRVYNRWGQLVYSSSSTETGWDGKIGGKDQASATFVWVVKGQDFTGKQVFAKGTVTLIR